MFESLAGPIIGSVVGGLMGGGNSSTQTTRVQLPEWLDGIGPMIGDVGQDLAFLPYQQYQGQRVADLSPETQMALDAMTNQAMGPGAEEAMSRQHAMNTMSGAYMPQSSNLQARTAFNPFIGQQAQGAFNPMIGQQASLGSASTANNPFIGQTTQSNILGTAQRYLDQSPALASNQFIGQQTNVGRNQYAGANPYLDNLISRNAQDMGDQFGKTVGTRLDSMRRASGSFGNTGIQEMEQDAYRNLNRDIGNMASNVRMQDYGMQQGLAEADLNRRVGAQQNDLSRNAGLQQGLSQFNAGMLDPLRAGQFGVNASIAQAGINQGDLSRNASLASNMSQFNAGAMNNMSQFNAGAMNNMGQFNSSMLQNQGQFNAGQANNMALNNANLMQNQGQFNAGAMNNMGQFNSNMNAGNWNAERNRMMNAGQMFPQYMSADQMRNQNLLGAGDIYRNYQQQLLDTNYQDWMGATNQPYRGLDVLTGIYGTGSGNAGTSTTSRGPDNTISNMIGGAMLGNSLVNSVNSGTPSYSMVPSSSFGPTNSSMLSMPWNGFNLLG